MQPLKEQHQMFDVVSSQFWHTPAAFIFNGNLHKDLQPHT